MLNSLIIKKLFGTYDYDLNFSTSEADKIRFVTGTNGYGKTTILRLINGIYKQDLNLFFTIPFEQLIYSINDAVIDVKQKSKPSINEDTDASDEIELEFAFGNHESMQSFPLQVNDLEAINNVRQQMELFFSSETCLFIDDRRLLQENTDSSDLVRFSELVKEKLQHRDNITDELVKVLEYIVNNSHFAHKTFEVSPNFGFRFTADDVNRTKLAMSSLSSGEQHILLISLYMLFQAPDGALILIDEPEMSFHLSWQGDYLKNLRKIVELRNVQCITATHSPFIFSSDYSLAIDLYEQMNPVEES